MGLQLEVTYGRTLAIRGTKKVVRTVQRINPTTHSYTIHIQMNAAGYLCSKLPVVLYEPSGVPKRFKDDVAKYSNLHVYWSKSGLMGAEIAKQWMCEVFLENIEEDSLLIIDAWKGYNQMMQIPEIVAKKLKIIQLPEHTTPILQPADVYFNRPFKDFIRKVCGKIRWQHNDFILSVRKNLLTILDMHWYQCKAPRFREFLKYSWYRAGYFSEHPQQFMTQVQYCLGFKGYMKCQSEDCTNYCFLVCAHCERHFCFYDAIEHRDHLES